jgi:hypothetical protein
MLHLRRPLVDPRAVVQGHVTPSLCLSAEIFHVLRCGARKATVIANAAGTAAAVPAHNQNRFVRRLCKRYRRLVAAGMPGAWIDLVHGRTPPEGVLLDMDSSESPTHGQQDGSAYNGHCAALKAAAKFHQWMEGGGFEAALADVNLVAARRLITSLKAARDKRARVGQV